jgi:hypothetical protein
VQPTRDDVLTVVDALPRSVGDLGLALVRRSGADVGEEGAPVGQRLAAAGLSLSALQRLVDGLVADRRVVELRGRELWDRGLPTAGTKALGRYYLAAGS